jgi:Neprosin
VVAGAYQNFNDGGRVSVLGSLSQHSPFVLTTGEDSRARIHVSNLGPFIDVGWMKSPERYTDSAPHLHFKRGDGNSYCFVAGPLDCGWVQVSATRNPEMTVAVTSTPQQYAMWYASGKWWIGYQGEWIGYFPVSLWSNSFTRISKVQWSGEVDSDTLPPCVGMGNGIEEHRRARRK